MEQTRPGGRASWRLASCIVLLPLMQKAENISVARISPTPANNQLFSWHGLARSPPCLHSLRSLYSCLTNPHLRNQSANANMMPERFSRSETLPRESKGAPSMMPQCFSRSETREKKRISDREIRFSRASTNSAAGIKRTAEHHARKQSNFGLQNSFFARFYKLCRGNQKERRI